MLLALVYPIILGLDRIESASLLRANGTLQYLTGLPSFPDPQTLRWNRNCSPPDSVATSGNDHIVLLAIRLRPRYPHATRNAVPVPNRNTVLGSGTGAPAMLMYVEKFGGNGGPPDVRRTKLPDEI